MESRLRASAVVLAGMLVVCLLASTDSAAVRSNRSVGDTSPSVNLSRVKFCRSSTPCGWAVYVPFTRRVDYFMKNTCECPQGKACLRSHDDLSVSAYVYRCHVDTSDQGEVDEPHVSWSLHPQPFLAADKKWRIYFSLWCRPGDRNKFLSWLPACGGVQRHLAAILVTASLLLATCVFPSSLNIGHTIVLHNSRICTHKRIVPHSTVS